MEIPPADEALARALAAERELNVQRLSLGRTGDAIAFTSLGPMGLRGRAQLIESYAPALPGGSIASA